MERVRIAFASSDRQKVDQHFGSAESFAVFEVTASTSQLLEVIEFIDNEQDGNENKLPAKIASLSGCAAVYCLAVGASAVKQLLAGGIQPVRIDEGASIERLIANIQAEIKAGPAGWLAKALRANEPVDERRFDEMEAEGWQE